MRKIVLLSGISGAGKSSYITNNYPGAIVVSADHYFIKDGQYKFNARLLGRAHEQCFNKFKEAIYRGLSINDICIVVDNTNTTLHEMRPYIGLAQKNDYLTEIIILKCDPKIASQRNVHNVPADTINKMATRLENTLKIIPKEWNYRVIE